MSSGRQNGMSRDGAGESVQGIFRLEDVGQPGKASVIALDSGRLQKTSVD